MKVLLTTAGGLPGAAVTLRQEIAEAEAEAEAEAVSEAHTVSEAQTESEAQTVSD